MNLEKNNSNLTRLEAELETITQEFSDHQKSEMDDKLEKSRTEIEGLNSANDTLSEEISDQKRMICNLQNSVSDSMQNRDEKNSDLLNEICVNKEEMDSMKESLKETHNERLRKDIDIEALRRELNTINGSFTEYKAVNVSDISRIGDNKETTKIINNTDYL
eukprot:TRINITY_DN2480_c0_g1_i1.p1 TRINITY_DN2480_c0_g1~~TRINITY_DN2480_c0_g1_i1.p1  ORF type:complete len:162 (+),score=49.84 TRINITY_DN2480_c0_g1_i1:182-667(+)